MAWSMSRHRDANFAGSLCVDFMEAAARGVEQRVSALQELQDLAQVKLIVVALFAFDAERVGKDGVLFEKVTLCAEQLHLPAVVVHRCHLEGRVLKEGPDVAG